MTSRCRAVLLDDAGRVNSIRMAKLSVNTTMNVIEGGLTVGSSLYFGGMIEQVEAKRDAGSLQALGELGHNPG